MKTVTSLKEIQENVKTLNKYLSSKKDPEYSFGLSLIKKGTCFLVLYENGRYQFYPSRFIGYAGNSMEAHLNNEDKDGRETNPVISKIMGSNPRPNPEFDKLYCEYCEYLGFTARERGSFGVERKYWIG